MLDIFYPSIRSENKLLFNILAWLQQRKQKFFLVGGAIRDISTGTYVGISVDGTVGRRTICRHNNGNNGARGAPGIIRE